MVDYINKSWKIFIANLNEISAGYKGALAIFFLFAVFLLFYNISKRFKKNERGR